MPESDRVLVLSVPVRELISPAELLSQDPSRHVFSRTYEIGDGELLVVVERQGDDAVVHLRTTLQDSWWLHWGLAERPGASWRVPPSDQLPAGSTTVDGGAARTPFTREGPRLKLDLRVPTPARPGGVRFLCAVLHLPDAGRWLRDGNHDFQLPLGTAGPTPGGRDPALIPELRKRIIDRETGAGSWTLMHRFELCAEMLEDVGADTGALALLTAWLRYSALRQLDWQRRYNTTPSRLAHAQDRLTRRIARLYREQASARPWAYMLLSSVGRGGEGQRVRDDILALMHRHHLKEVAGTFVEQWHQKLHNNATPDDIAICEAYVAFLRSGGDVAAFDEKLSAHGVTRARLRSYERPILADPVMPPADIPALVQDLGRYLNLLRSVHASTDLDSARAALQDHLPSELDAIVRGLLERSHLEQEASSAGAHAERVLDQVARARALTAERLTQSSDEGRVRDLLYLDLALSDALRAAVEQLGALQLDVCSAVAVVGAGLRALSPGVDDPEFSACARHWRRLPKPADSDVVDLALHARSIVERLARWIGAQGQSLVDRIRTPALELGRAFQAEEWAVATFAEEMVRGGPLFALASLLGRADAALRRVAELGPWQVVSPAEAGGTVVRVHSLIDIQGRTFGEAVVVVSDHVSGAEEIPPEVTAVVTPQGVDLLSHLAVRARESRVLLATLWDKTEYSLLARTAGATITIGSTGSGDAVTWARCGREEALLSAPRADPAAAGTDLARAARLTGSVLMPAEFAPGRVGAKSLGLAELRETVPPGVQIPVSMAIGFGGLERALEYAENGAPRRELALLERTLDQEAPRALGRIRDAIARLRPAPELVDELLEAARAQGLPMEPIDASWKAITRVWASKWNDRAYHARRARGVPHARVHMAVLIQRVVEADYAFVLHTRNPLAPRRDEMVGELVLGLGETLVGNYPGRALGFVVETGNGSSRIVSYPSKSTVLRASGLIFRSDSNAEDLEGFSGAGLHDSVVSSETRPAVADYADEPLIHVPVLRARVIDRLRRLAVDLERARGAPQDIEGAVAGGVVFLLQARPQAGI